MTALNPRQRSKGALLVFPKTHFTHLTETPDEVLFSLMELIDKSHKLLVKKYSPDGVYVFINAGIKAGQSEDHMHFQIIPRYKDVEYSFERSRAFERSSFEDLEPLAKEIKHSLEEK